MIALGLSRGWFDSGSVEGTTSGFEPQEAPKGQESAGSWPEYGFDAERTRANPALDLAPPFRREWSHDAGSLLEFPPAIADGRAIVGTNFGLAMAVDVETGREIWRTHTRGRVASSPAIDGPRALFTTKRGDVLALDTATGKELWRRQVRSPVESSPLVVGDSAYIGTLSQRVLKLDTRTGGVRWSVPAPGGIKASLALSGPNVIVGDYSGHVVAFRRSDGKQVWSRTSPGERISGSPSVVGDLVYVSTLAKRPEEGRTYGLDPRTGGRRFTFDDGRYSPAVGIDGVLVLTGVHTLYGLTPR